MSFKSAFESRESQFNTAGGSKFQVRGVAVLNDRLANDVRRNGTRSSGTDDDRVLRAYSFRLLGTYAGIDGGVLYRRDATRTDRGIGVRGRLSPFLLSLKGKKVKA